MPAELTSVARPVDRPPSAWMRLTGGSVGLVAGFGIDLLRLGAHRAGQALAARRRAAPRGWPCTGPCGAGQH